MYLYYDCSSIFIIPLFSSEESSEEKTDIHIVPGSLVPMRPPNQKPYPNPFPHPRHSENNFEVLSRNNLRSVLLSSATSNWLKDLSTPDFSTLCFNTIPFNPGLCNYELSNRTFQPQTSQPWTFQPQTSQPQTFQPQVWGWKIHGWKFHGWKVRGWKVWGRSLGLKSPGLKCPLTVKLWCFGNFELLHVITLFDCSLVSCLVIGSKNAQSQNFHCTFPQLDRKKYRPD